tara:strand:+ start:705 stop:1103 length:399 start_codon:yes stop_codon:yes gene_type:complete
MKLVKLNPIPQDQTEDNEYYSHLVDWSNVFNYPLKGAFYALISHNIDYEEGDHVEITVHVNSFDSKDDYDNYQLSDEFGGDQMISHIRLDKESIAGTLEIEQLEEIIRWKKQVDLELEIQRLTQELNKERKG